MSTNPWVNLQHTSYQSSPKHKHTLTVFQNKILWLKKTWTTAKLHTENKLQVFTAIFDYLMAYFCISTPFRRNVQPPSAGWPVWVRWMLKWSGWVRWMLKWLGWVRWMLKWLGIRVGAISAVADSSWCRVPLVALLWPLLNGGGGGLPRVGRANCVCTSSGINPSCPYDLVADTFTMAFNFAASVLQSSAVPQYFAQCKLGWLRSPPRLRCFRSAPQVQPCGQKLLGACNLWLVLQPMLST